jgi:HD-like signal output (HDOD) protein
VSVAQRAAQARAMAVMPITATAPPQPAPVNLQIPFIEWLLDTGTTLDVPLRMPEQYLLGRLDAALASDKSRGDMLPRARAVIPQLLNSLRDESRSIEALAARVSKDPHLVAEVLRLANGAAGTEPAADLPQAIQRVGIDGLRRVIASVVLKPMFDAQVDALSARAAPKLWLHSEAKAIACMQFAADAGIDPFEGYLAGLLHNVGWTAALRAIDRSGSKPAMPFSREFVEALEPRRERFFALLVSHWQLTDSLDALALEMVGTGLQAATSALGHALRAADREASMKMLGATAPAPAEATEPVPA